MPRSHTQVRNFNEFSYIRADIEKAVKEAKNKEPFQERVNAVMDTLNTSLKVLHKYIMWCLLSSSEKLWRPDLHLCLRQSQTKDLQDGCDVSVVTVTTN